MWINKKRLQEVILESETIKGKAFDLGLIFCIFMSVLVVILESVSTIFTRYSVWIEHLEIFFTALFTLELILRLYIVPNKYKYLFSFFGMVDLISILPLYLQWVFPGIVSLGIIRIFRLLRIFRILKLERFLNASTSLTDAIRLSLPRVIIFLLVIVMITTIMGSIIFVLEGPQNGFTNIPESIYWAVLNLTSVGDSEIFPKTVLGKIFSSLLMIIGYGIIAVPTGLISAEIVNNKIRSKKKLCHHCGHSTIEEHSNFCSHCGQKL
jgi:voltage-gated potassium channel